MPVVVCDADTTIVSCRISQNLRAAIAHLATSMMDELAVSNLHDLYRSGVLLDDEKAFQWFQSNRLLASRMACFRCEISMVLEKSKVADGVAHKE